MVKRTLGIDTVEAESTKCNTASDEERDRQGFEVQTVFAWFRRHGRIEVTAATPQTDERPLIMLQYANSAEISRTNKSPKRRRNQTGLGLMIDLRIGYRDKVGNEDLEPATVAAQIAKFRSRFKIQQVARVCDRGMLTTARIREDLEPVGLDWISALTTQDIRKLLKTPEEETPEEPKRPPLARRIWFRMLSPRSPTPTSRASG